MKVNTGYADSYYTGYRAATGTVNDETFAESMAKAGSGAVTGTGVDEAKENASKSQESTSSTNIRDMSDKEWDKLIKHVDNFIEDFKEAVEYEKEVSEANKEKSEETSKDLVEMLADKVTANREFTKVQELALTGSTEEGVSSVDGTTECASVENIGEAKTTWTVTAFSEDVCRKQVGARRQKVGVDRPIFLCLERFNFIFALADQTHSSLDCVKTFTCVKIFLHFRSILL